MLCFRCEHRARFLETGSRPRHECGTIEQSKATCYMFMPCLPVLTEPEESELPRFSGQLLSCRETAVRVMEKDELFLTPVYRDKKKVALIWLKK